MLQPYDGTPAAFMSIGAKSAQEGYTNAAFDREANMSFATDDNRTARTEVCQDVEARPKSV
jgi:hypothetical protein